MSEELTNVTIPLAAVHQAALTITSELSLPRVLESIVKTARQLIGVRYAALGVPGPQGTLEQFITEGMSQEEVERVEKWPVGKGLLGAIQREPQTIRLDNMQDSPLSSGFCAHHPIMTSFLGVPIVARGEILGSLYLCDKEDGSPFSAADQSITETLAAYAAVAIENARLYQQVRRLAVLEERERIGMDLHDGIIQSIYAVGLTLEHSNLLLEEDPEAAKIRLRYAIDALNRTIRDIRNYIMDLRPQRMKVLDLKDSLHRLAEEFRANTLTEVDLEMEPDVEKTLDEGITTALFHITQEALANAAKHAAATNLRVSVRRDNHHVLLTVKDNGVGFNEAGENRLLGHGLSNMSLRAQSVGGRLRVESHPNLGTTITATFPSKKDR